MAVVLGTNAGFVSEAPVADPSSGSFNVLDNLALATRDVAPTGAGKITEIGWWARNATEEANFEVGLYSHDSENNEPDVRLFVDNTNAKGTASGWKTVTVDWDITEGTTYWLAAQLDNTGTDTRIDRADSGGWEVLGFFGAGALGNPWVTLVGPVARITAIYAVWESGISYSELSGTCVGAGSGSGDLDYMRAYNTYRHLVVAGNNQIWFEGG